MVLLQQLKSVLQAAHAFHHPLALGSQLARRSQQAQPLSCVQGRPAVDLEAAQQAVQEQMGSEEWSLAEIERAKLAQARLLPACFRLLPLQRRGECVCTHTHTHTHTALA